MENNETESYCYINGHDFYYYPALNEAGWKCLTCNFKPGEPEGFSPLLDRDLVYEKIESLAESLTEGDIFCISNSTEADLMISEVVDRCISNGYFDQTSIVKYLLEARSGRAEYWKDLSENILAGNDPRPRCDEKDCGKLATMISSKKFCKEHMSFSFLERREKK